MPRGALQFVDAVVIGEAESVWPQVLVDMAQGELKRVYRGEWLDLTGMRPPQRDIFDSNYTFAAVQASRGCPLDCDFCSVTAFNGRRTAVDQPPRCWTKSNRSLTSCCCSWTTM